VFSSTVAAISTPLGSGGIGVIRISGEEATQVADKLFKSLSGRKISELKGYSALYGEFFDSDGRIDNGVAIYFRAPKSYTGENVVELSCHGGTHIAKRLLRACIQAGASAAGPGEFTKRAFLNGKLDLIEAESVMGLIGAVNDQQLKLLSGAHTGKTSEKIALIKQKLIGIAAAVSVNADYPDEDLPELEGNRLLSDLEDTLGVLETALKEYDAGKILREGIDTVIVGKPNVGKSTLMNLLSGTKRSIVTEIAGTTRDVIEDTVTLGDIILRLADTAGIHATGDMVESAGVELAKERLSHAQLVLAVFDASAPLDADDREILEAIKDKNVIIILNKWDKPRVLSPDDFKNFYTVCICAKQGDGLEELKAEVERIAGIKDLDTSAAVLISERQRECALKAKNAVQSALDAINSGLTTDAVGICIDDAIAALLELTGERVTNEVTDEIFRSFCVGK